MDKTAQAAKAANEKAGQMKDAAKEKAGDIKKGAIDIKDGGIAKIVGDAFEDANEMGEDAVDKFAIVVDAVDGKDVHDDLDIDIDMAENT